MENIDAINVQINEAIKQRACAINHIDKILYPGCLSDSWHMAHSERLAITAILQRVRPMCSIEIGTYQGGSLSLISQLSTMVFSIDICHDMVNKLNNFKNVSFLTGSSVDILPVLLDKLDKSNIPVEFILIDGDHSAAGVKADIESVLSYTPKKPLFVIMHDSFNPECRKGMLDANWERSRYLDTLDLDFVPGRILGEGHQAKGEMWGGLGMAYFQPSARNDPVHVYASAKEVFETCNARNVK